jgi:PIN domain nuclease of toxin-antitoxin system
VSPLLLDTHALVWLLQGSRFLGPAARQMAGTAAQDQALFVSAITFWEVAMLQGRGRLVLPLPVVLWRRNLLETGVLEVPITGEIGILAAELQDFHPDPADRIIAATAQLQGAVLLTADARILNWTGQLQRHDARK